MKRHFLGIIILFLFSINCIQSKNDNDNTYPTPERLFHIARSVNKNLVCYDLNIVNGEVNAKEPLKVYWVNREKHPGEKNGLSYIQRKLAYGYKVVSTTPHYWICALQAYPKRQILLAPYKKGWACFVTINKQKAILNSLYVKSNKKNSLKVEYVEIRGKSLSTQCPIMERIRK